jgi:hypothetical protein
MGALVLYDDDGNPMNVGKSKKVTGSQASFGYQYTPPAGFTGGWSDKCKKKHHPATEPVMIGGYPIWLGKEWDIKKATIDEMSFICPLNGMFPRDVEFGKWMLVLGSKLPDRGSVPANWENYIKFIAESMKEGKKILAYCTGSHGRTGTFGASLISVMEPETEDPIDAIRKRHCEKCVESKAQAEAVFALRGLPLPDKYKEEFKPVVYSYSGASGYGHRPLFVPAQAPWPENADLKDFFMEAWRHCTPIRGWEGPDNKQHPGKVIIWIGPEEEDDLIVPMDNLVAVLTALTLATGHYKQWNELRDRYLRPKTDLKEDVANPSQAEVDGGEAFYGF